MEALTIWQPWAWAIGAGLKLVENRDWLPRPHILKEGQDLAIHSSVKLPSQEDLYACRLICKQLGKPFPSLDGFELGPMGRGRIVAVVTFAGVATSKEQLPEQQRPWWRGKYAWRFENVRQLNIGSAPQARGQQGLWCLPGGPERLVTCQLMGEPGQLWRRTA